MLSSLVALISLNLTLSLVSTFGVVAGTLPITGATATTPILVTSTSHGVPLGRVVHGVVSGVTGEVEANGLWILTPTDADTFALTTLTAQGLPVESVGLNSYAGGGTISYAFPDYQILLGRRNVALASSVASPRVVFVPTHGRAWDFEPYGGVGAPAELPPVRGSLEAQSANLQPQLATEFSTFEVYVTGCASPPSPDAGDFDATQFLVNGLAAVLWDMFGPRARVLREAWPSQTVEAGTTTQRGQQWFGVVEFEQPITHVPMQFVPVGTYLVETVQPVNAGSADSTVIKIT